MTTPVRLRLSRARGFNLQACSFATNGLDVARVDRCTIWGNPFGVTPGRHRSPDGKMRPVIVVGSSEEAIERFRNGLVKGRRRRRLLGQLRGKNLACWCKPGAPCHADVLLELANQPRCEEVTP
jgi:hypothetical protein